jgi:hypothetical protein
MKKICLLIVSLGIITISQGQLNMDYYFPAGINLTLQFLPRKRFWVLFPENGICLMIKPSGISKNLRQLQTG